MKWVRDDVAEYSDDELLDAIVRKDRELDGAPDNEFTQYTQAIRDTMADVYVNRG